MKLENSTQTNAQKTPPVIRNGFTKVPNTIFSINLSPEEKIAYIALLSYDWYKEGCYPSREILSKDTGLSERTLVEVIKKLEEKELVISKRRGNRQTNYYTLPPIILPSDSPPPETEQAAASNEIERLPDPVVEPEAHAVSSAPAEPIPEPINSEQETVSAVAEPEIAVTVCEQKADFRSAESALQDSVRSANPALLMIDPEKDAFKTEKDTHARQSAPKRSRKSERKSVGIKTKSRFSLEECKRYALSLVNAGIKYPLGFAKSVWMSGTDDEAIREFLRMEAETEAKRTVRQAEQEARTKSQLQEAARLILEGDGPTKDWEYKLLEAAGIFYPGREGV
jgi:DNA-binding transcriptional ArsR family regulator